MSFPASPIALTASTNTTIPLPGITTIDQIDWIVFSNNSPYVLEITCGGLLFHIPAWYFYPFPLVTTDSTGKRVRLFTAGNSVQVATVQQTIPGSQFTAQLFYTIYLNNETPPQTVPSPLGGGPIDLTVASSINQTGQPGGNSVVFAEPVGDTSVIGAVNINNLGQAVLGDLSNKGSLLIEGLSTDYNISLSLTGGIRISNSSGNLVTDLEQGFLKLNDSAGTNRIDLEATSGIAINLAGTVINGSVSGTITFYAPLWGSGFKILIVRMNNYNSANVASFNFPSLFSTGFIAFGGVGASMTLSLFKTGVAQTINLITTLGGAAAGADTGQTVMHGDSIGFFTSLNGADQIQVGSTGAAAWYAPIILVGV